jgi:predicted nucleic acid-binding protein
VAIKRILLDSSYLFSLLYPQDKNHDISLSYSKGFRGEFILTYVVLTETAFLFNRQGGMRGVALFIDKLTVMNPTLEPVTFEDLARVREIMTTYPTARLDFVDCCIMALSERLDIVQVCTFDQRDFGIFRPKHVDYLEIMP